MPNEHNEHVYIRVWGGEVPASNVLAVDGDPETECQAAEVARFIIEALRQQPPLTRASYRYYLMGFDASAIGRVVGISPNAVHHRVMRAHRAVLRYVGERIGNDD